MSRNAQRCCSRQGPGLRQPAAPDRRRVVDRGISRQRNLVARFFNKLKHFRRIATRYDKLTRNYLAAALMAATRLWTRAYESTT
jgi:transposase